MARCLRQRAGDGVAQVFLAGQAIADLRGSGDFTTHIGFGYAIGIVQLATLSSPSRRGRRGRDKWICAGITCAVRRSRRQRPDRVPVDLLSGLAAATDACSCAA
jgi:hypothetical protein